MRDVVRAPTVAFAPANDRQLRKYGAVDKIEVLDYRGHTYLAYETARALFHWRKSRSSRPVTREILLRDLQALLEGLLALDEKENVIVPPLPSTRSPQTTAAIKKQLVKATPVLRPVLRGN